MPETDIFFESATPSLYRKNAFRIAGLFADATPKEIAKYEEKRQMLERLGKKTELKSPLPLDPPPDEDSIREAMQRLRDPERRLIDEFFWFWNQEIGRGNQDNALVAALVNGDIQGAVDIWINQERASEANVSVHNVAVLYHCIALDFEQDALLRPLLHEDMEILAGYWKDSYKRWQFLIGYDPFWKRLKSRIKELNYPSLTDETADNIKRTISEILLFINAQLAVKFAEKGDTANAARQIQIIKNSGLRDGEGAALKRATEPLRRRAKSLCQSVGAQSAADVEHSDKQIERFLDAVENLLLTMDNILPATDMIRINTHDEAALAAFNGIIAFVNKTKEYQKALPVLQRAQKMASSSAVIARFQENIKAIETNLCWFCKRNNPDPNSEVAVNMYGEVKNDYTTGKVAWKYYTVKVPRCQRCRTEHGKMFSGIPIQAGTGCMTGVITFMLTLGLMACLLWTGAHMFVSMAILAVLAIFIGRTIYKSYPTEEGKKFILKEKWVTAPLSSKNQYPIIKELKSKGWNEGTYQPPGGYQ